MEARHLYHYCIFMHIFPSQFSDDRHFAREKGPPETGGPSDIREYYAFTSFANTSAKISSASSSSFSSSVAM